MPVCQLSITIEKPFINLIDDDWLEQVVGTTLDTALMTAPVAIELVIAGDDTVHKLNHQYRGIDSTTDVLAFALSESDIIQDSQFIMPPDSTTHLGEVIVCYQQAERQAIEHNIPLKYEFSLLIVHGVLHLLGYDHMESDEEQTMRELETKIMRAIEKLWDSAH